MSKPAPPSAPTSPGFEVEITSGGRAYGDGEASRTTPTLSPARAEAKARARRRTNLIIAMSATLFAAIVLWAWLSNPNSLIPSDAVARVNGEYIYDRDIAREMDLTRVYDELDTSKVFTPTAPSALETLIITRIQVQDAKKSGVVVSTQDVENKLAELPARVGFSQEQFVSLLSKYNRTLDDMRSSVRDALLLTSHINDNVARSGKSEDEKRILTNTWQTRLVQSARIERLKPAGSGPAPRIGSEAPDFTLKDIDGKEVKLSALRGRPVMLNFWATWCPPCRAEIPTIVELYKRTHKEGAYEILGVASQSDTSTIKAYAQEFGMSFPIAPDVESRITSLYHVLPIPTSFFIDKDGIIRYAHFGIVDKETMEKWLLGK